MIEKVEEEAIVAPPGLRLPLAATECFAKLPEGRLRFLRAGSGPPLVLLHGLLGYSFSWRFNLAELARHRTVFAVDQLGTGFSDRPSSIDCSMHGVASRTLAFLEQEIEGPFDPPPVVYPDAHKRLMAYRPGLPGRGRWSLSPEAV